MSALCGLRLRTNKEVVEESDSRRLCFPYLSVLTVERGVVRGPPAPLA